MSRTTSRENLRDRFISDEEAEFLSNNHPGVNRFGFCPTCGGTGLYKFRTKRNKRCDCVLQTQLYKHYLSAGIPVSYQRLSWKDFKGDKSVLQAVNSYINNMERMISSGIGLLLTGTNGVGKTFVLTLMQKDLVCMGYRTFFVVADDMFSMKTDGWTDDDEKQRYNKKVKNSDVLVIDDAGKEFSNKLTKQTFESLVRYRVQNSLTTFISSNRSLLEFRAEYGESFYSLLTGSFKVADISAEDFRPTALEERLEEIENDWVRPIV